MHLNLQVAQQSRFKMFAVGHLALGYIIGKLSSRILKVKVNIPLLFVASIAPDIDLLIPGVEHRGPTHSLILLLLFSIPLMLIWRKQAIPFAASLMSHPLLGDYLTSINRSQGVQLLFPLSGSWFYGNVGMVGSMLPILEIVLLGVMMILLFISKDIKQLVQPHSSNILLSIPIITALLPVFTRFPIPVPKSLIIPHVILIVFLSIPIFIDLKAKLIGYYKTSTLSF